MGQSKIQTIETNVSGIFKLRAQVRARLPDCIYVFFSCLCTIVNVMFKSVVTACPVEQMHGQLYRHMCIRPALRSQGLGKYEANALKHSILDEGGMADGESQSRYCSTCASRKAYSASTIYLLSHSKVGRAGGVIWLVHIGFSSSDLFTQHWFEDMCCCSCR